MNCPKELRQCPNGWTDCSFCANKQRCDDGTYEPEPEPEIEEHELEVDLGIVIEVVEEIRQESVRCTWAEKLSQMSEAERWAEYRRFRPPNLLIKEPLTCMGGPSAPGGGGKVKTKKDTKGHKPTAYKWGEFK